MPKKSAFTYMPGHRLTVPGKRGVQGFVSYPMNKADGEADLKTLAKDGADTEGRVIFVTWIAEDGTRQRSYFTEACLNAANPTEASFRDVGAFGTVLRDARKRADKRAA